MKPATPLRYPGGKQRLTPFIREIIEANQLSGGCYAEPYAGGAGVAIELLLSEVVSSIRLNDISFPIYAFWKSILGQPEAFCKKVTSASLTIPEWRRQREILKRHREFELLDVAFSLFYLNRCNRSGILSGGVIGGLAQNGEWKIDARFPRNELIRRIELIATKKKSITVTNLDAEQFIVSVVPKLPRKTLVYCDPPYFEKADRLYENHYKPDDHARLASLINDKLKTPWLVSYDAAEEIKKGFSTVRSIQYSLQYNAAKAYKGSEVFFFSPNLTVPKSSVIPAIDKALANLSTP